MKPEKTPLQEKTIGVAGLGQMGFPMACRIQQAGYQVLGHDILRKHLDGPISLKIDTKKSLLSIIKSGNPMSSLPNSKTSSS